MCSFSCGSLLQRKVLAPSALKQLKTIPLRSTQSRPLSVFPFTPLPCSQHMEVLCDLVLGASGNSRAYNRPHSDVGSIDAPRKCSRVQTPPTLPITVHGRLSQRALAEAQSLCTWAQFPNSLFSRKLGVAFPNPFLMKLLRRRPVRSVIFSVKTVPNVCERLLCARHCAEPFRCIISFNLKMARGVSTAITLIFKTGKLREQRQYVIFGVTKLLRNCNTGLEHVFFFKTLLKYNTHSEK